MAVEEDAEKTQKNIPNSRQQHSALATTNFDANDDQNIRGNGNELFGSLPLMKRRRMRGSAHQKRSGSSNSRSGTAKKKMAKAMDKQQEMEMARAGLIVSLLMLAGICAVHLLLFADNPPTGLTSKHQNGIDAISHFGHPLPVDHSFIPKIRKRADQLVQRQLEKLTEDLARLPANFRGFQQTTNQMPPFRVNMLLTEQRRRNAVQRPRSATPIPSMGTNLPMSTHRQSRRAPRASNSASNSENWPPQHLTEPSTSGQQMEVGEEPTLMDYDAIDAYWRWDIEQEKEPTSVLMQQSHQYPHNNNNFQFGQQQPQRWMPSAQNGEPGESATQMLLYERDIQLLTEKTQFPELSIFDQNDGPSNGLVASTEEDEEYLLADISQNKWEMPPQWPTTSSRENQHFGGAEFGLEDQNNEGNEILWTTQRIAKLVPFQTTGRSNNVDEGIGTELWNIPVVTPPPGAILDSEHQQQNVPPIGAEEEAPLSSPNSCLQFPQFIPSPQQTSFDRPILFGDVSLAEAALNLEDTDGNVEETLSNLEATQFSDQFPSTTAAFSISNPNFAQFQSSTTEPQTEEEEDEMLLSTLFPQLFYPNGPAENGSDPLVPFPIQRSPSLNSVLSDGANANLEVILRELATAELLLNASNMAAAISPSHPLSPLQIPLTLQTPQAFTQQAYFPPIGAFPSIGLNSLSPMLEQFNQTQQQLINVPSSSAGLASSSLLAPAQDRDLFCLPQSRISARCSSTTSSGFGSSGPDTLASTSPSFGFGPVALPDDSNPQNSPIFRYEDKLVPKAIKMEKKGKNGGNGPEGNANVEMERPKAKGKRGRRSKDDSLVNQHGLPFSAERLAAMSYREYATLMADGRLTGEQKTMIKKIRRRGRNKLAARKCRERRLNIRGEEDGEEDEFNGEEEEDEIIDVGQPQIYGEDEDSNQSSSLDNFYEEEMKYEPAGISLYPSTSTASHPQQMMIPSKMRSGQNPKTIKQDNQPDKAAAIRVQF